MFKKQKGYTLIELIVVLVGVVAVVALGVVAYTLFHFIGKAW